MGFSEAEPASVNVFIRTRFRIVSGLVWPPCQSPRRNPLRNMLLQCKDKVTRMSCSVLICYATLPLITTLYILV